MLNRRFDWVRQRHYCRGPGALAVLWREAAADVEAANELLSGGVERPFSLEPAPQGEEDDPPQDSFVVRRRRPDGSVDEVAFLRRPGVVQAAGFGHRNPLTAVFEMDHEDGLVKAMLSYTSNGDDLMAYSDAPWQLLSRALGPLFFGKPDRPRR